MKIIVLGVDHARLAVATDRLDRRVRLGRGVRVLLIAKGGKGVLHRVWVKCLCTLGVDWMKMLSRFLSQDSPKALALAKRGLYFFFEQRARVERVEDEEGSTT